MPGDEDRSGGVPGIPAGDLPAVLLWAIDAAQHGITIALAAGDRPLVYANAAFLRMTGYPAGEILGRNCRFLQGPDTDPERAAAIRDFLDSGRDVSVVLRNYRRDGTPFWNEISISAVRDPDGRTSHFIGTQIDVTERIDAEQQLQHLAYTDPVTGLSNREHLTARFDALKDQSPPGMGVAVVFLDLDRFHGVNENFDFETGNLVLAGVAERLATLASFGDVLARLDADNFVFLRPARTTNCTQVAQQIAAAAQRVVIEPIHTPEMDILVRVDTGIAIYPVRAARRDMHHQRGQQGPPPL